MKFFWFVLLAPFVAVGLLCPALLVGLILWPVFCGIAYRAVFPKKRKARRITGNAQGWPGRKQEKPDTYAWN